MDDYQKMERLDTENDYEGGEWIGGEFFYKKRKERSKKFQTKDDVTYGIWADDDGSSDSDGGGGSSSKRRKKGILSSSKDYTKPVNFVSTGIVIPNQELKEQDGNVEGKPGLGVGNGGGRGGLGLGFKSNNTEKVSDGGGDSENEDDHGLLPIAFGKKIEEGVQRRMKQKEKEKEKGKLVNKSKIQFGSKKETGGVGDDIGEFEKHTKGVGMKLLVKMGMKEVD
ncbi:hypothetical protein C5167_017475 [Papaver somniferum]|uniref:Tuftelin interacting protein N-terminal domain-containing protein n=1 Tax=Papaver somniferum TaxID=3469 RepID=A0A4Y7INI8_PAPSO|nr:hypothetical protein C5167_017475 [Papaver somniferum]